MPLVTVDQAASLSREHHYYGGGGRPQQQWSRPAATAVPATGPLQALPGEGPQGDGQPRARGLQDPQRVRGGGVVDNGQHLAPVRAGYRSEQHHRVVLEQLHILVHLMML